MTSYRWTTELELMKEHKVRHQGKGNGFGFQIKNTNDISGTLTATEKGIDYNLIETPKQLRRLTPIECERLQGFPSGWTKYGIDEKGNKVEISDTQRYKMAGNAVTTNVVNHIFKYLDL